MKQPLFLAILCGVLLAWLAWPWPHAPKLRAMMELRKVEQVQFDL